MAIFKNHFPPRQDLLYVLAACVFPVHVWALIVALQEVPALILRLNVWDMVGVIAYSQMYVLAETLLLFGGLLILGTLLPARFLRHRFLALATMLVFVTAAWFVFLQYNRQLIDGPQVAALFVWGISYLFVVSLFYFFIYRNPKLETAIQIFGKRLATLSFLYLFLDFLSIIIIIIRNVA